MTTTKHPISILALLCSLWAISACVPAYPRSDLPLLVNTVILGRDPYRFNYPSINKATIPNLNDAQHHFVYIGNSVFQAGKLQYMLDHLFFSACYDKKNNFLYTIGYNTIGDTLIANKYILRRVQNGATQLQIDLDGSSDNCFVHPEDQSIWVWHWDAEPKLSRLVYDKTLKPLFEFNPPANLNQQWVDAVQPIVYNLQKFEDQNFILSELQADGTLKRPWQLEGALDTNSRVSQLTISPNGGLFIKYIDDKSLKRTRTIYWRNGQIVRELPDDVPFGDTIMDTKLGNFYIPRLVTYVGGGKFHSHFTLESTLAYYQNWEQVGETVMLQPIAANAVAHVGSGQFFYVAPGAETSVREGSAVYVMAGTQALGKLPGASYEEGFQPYDVAVDADGYLYVIGNMPCSRAVELQPDLRGKTGSPCEYSNSALTNAVLVYQYP